MAIVLLVHRSQLVFLVPVETVGANDWGTHLRQADELKKGANEAKNEAKEKGRSFLDNFLPRRPEQRAADEAQHHVEQAKRHAQDTKKEAKSALGQAEEAIRSRAEQVGAFAPPFYTSSEVH